MPSLSMILMAAILLIGGLSTAYFFYSQSRIATLEQTMQVEKDAVTGLQTTLDTFKEESAQIKTATDNLNGQLSMIQQQTDQALQKLNRQDLTKLGAAHPKLVEDAVNKASTDYFSQIQTLSKNAK